MIRLRSVVLGASVLLACGGDDGRESSTAATTMTMASIGSADASAGATTGATADVPTTGATGDPATSAPADTTSGLKFDIGTAETGAATSGGMSGCEKVDFLFVIDNSASMEDNQAALIKSFPGFIAAIQATLTATSDYHIMVVDTDDDGRCKQPCDLASGDVIEFCAEKSYHACNANLNACDTTRGAGVVHPVGSFASNKKCTIAGGNRYMIPGEADLPATFACVATVGTAGNPSERPMNGMTEALGAAINEPGGCNAGFLRDDAILVITVISDDPNYEDEGTAQAWYDAVLAAKNGDAGAVVVAALIPVLDDLACINNGDIQGAHWREFVEKWGDHGIMGTVCATDYAPFFEQAVAVIDDTCDNFMPPT